MTIDANKTSAHRGQDISNSAAAIPGFQDGWMKLSQVAFTVTDLFEMSAEAHTTVKSGVDLGEDEFGVTFAVTGLGNAGNLIPKLVTDFDMQASTTLDLADDRQ